MKSFIAKAFALTLACLSHTVCAETHFDVEDGVLQLNKETYADEIAEKGFLLVMVYAPWCGHCAIFAPEVKAVVPELLKMDPPRYIAVMDGDAEQNREVSNALKIEGFPTFIWYESGKKRNFDSDKDRASIVQWYKKRTGAIASTDVIHSKKLTCEELPEYEKKQELGAFLFSSDKDKMFNFYQEIQQDLLDKKSYVIDLARVQDFTFYHSEPQCITHFFPDRKTDETKYEYGILVMTSPGNSPEQIEDTTGFGLGVESLAKFMTRMSSPAFDQMTMELAPWYFNQDPTPEAKQFVLLISRDPWSEPLYPILQEAAQKQKYFMKYAWVGGPKPTEEQLEAKKQAKEDEYQHNKALNAKRDAFEKENTRTDPEDETTGMDPQILKNEITKMMEENKFVRTKEQREGEAAYNNEDIFKQVRKTFGIKKASQLPALFIFDPRDKPKVQVYVELDQKQKAEMTVEKMIDLATKFNNQWIRPVAKSQPLELTNESDNDMTIVGANYEKFVASEENEILINHTIDNSPFCKLLNPQWKQLADQLSVVPGLNFGNMNPEENTVAYVDIASFPTVMHFTPTNKIGKIVKFNNRKGKAAESIKKWLSENSDAYKAYLVDHPEGPPEYVAPIKEEVKEPEAAEPQAEDKTAGTEKVDLDQPTDDQKADL